MKSMFSTTGLSVIMLSVVSHANAATLIETEGGEQGVQQMWVEGSKMRINTGKGKEYMLADYAKKQIVMVNPAEKEMIDASYYVNQGSDSSKGLNIQVKHLGGGPVIAKYSTQKYSLIVNGRTCNTTLVSAKALKDTNLAPLMEAMTQMEFNPMGSQFMSECDRAELSFAKRLKKLGMPLGTIDNNGQMRDKVRRIVKNAPLPPGGFTLPKGYRKVSMQQKMQEAMGGGMPPGAAGQMDPEMQKMMQEMMRQQGR